jgi:ribonucleoside-diphosphate reductase alpha chain
VVIRSEDNLSTLLDKLEIATILGTLQSTLCDFKFVSEDWINNTQEERLLGVSLTGIMDNKLTSNPRDYTLVKMRDYARFVNSVWSKKLGIRESTAITCVKPSGTVSQLCDAASGIHPRHDPFYIRTVRVDKKDPLYEFMRDKGVPVEDEQLRPENVAVFSFAVRSPEGSKTRADFSAIESLQLWQKYQNEWCEHKPSVTISVKEEEWPEVGAWVWNNFDALSGVSFLPYSDHTYVQAPYQTITEDEYNDWIQKHPLPEVDWTELAEYEDRDNTTGAQHLACSAGGCEIDIVIGEEQ